MKLKNKGFLPIAPRLNDEQTDINQKDIV